MPVPSEELATVNEAAFVAGVSRHAVNQSIDRREIRTRGRAGARMIGAAEILYLRVQPLLSPRTRRAVYRRLAERRTEPLPPEVHLDGDVRLDLRAALAAVRERLAEVRRARARVEENPAIRGGEPVFRGTRIPVHLIADLLRQGAPRAELLEDYPSLDDEALDVALRWTELHPRRGRPREAPWRSRPPVREFAPPAEGEGPVSPGADDPFGP